MAAYRVARKEWEDKTPADIQWAFKNKGKAKGSGKVHIRIIDEKRKYNAYILCVSFLCVVEYLTHQCAIAFSKITMRQSMRRSENPVRALFSLELWLPKPGMPCQKKNER